MLSCINVCHFFHNGTFRPWVRQAETAEAEVRGRAARFTAATGVTTVAQRKTTSKAGGKGRTSKRSTKKARAPRPTRSGSARRARSASRSAAGDEEVAIDRRRKGERRVAEKSSCKPSTDSAPQLERRKKVNRRRQIDPTTCERDYTEDEVEFMNALDDYKRRSGRMFPTCSEVLEVVRGLGYVKVTPAELEAVRGTGDSAASAKPMTGDWPESIANDGPSAAAGPALVDESQTTS